MVGNQWVQLVLIVLVQGTIYCSKISTNGVNIQKNKKLFFLNQSDKRFNCSKAAMASVAFRTIMHHDTI